MKSTKLIFAVMLVIAMILTACGSNPTATPTKPAAASTGPQGAYPAQGTNPTAPAQAGYPAPTTAAPANSAYPAQGSGVEITKKDGSKTTVSFDAAAKIASAKVTIDGKEQTGFKLSDFLKAGNASITGKVTVTAENGSVALTQDQANGAYISIVNNKLRLMVSGTASEKWLVGITTIKLE